MDKQNQTDNFPSVATLCLFVLAGLLHMIKPTVSVVNTLFFLISTFIYLGLIICWSVYIVKRFISERIRSMLISMAFFLLIYILIRTIKYRYISTDYPGVLRFLWYLYYVPQVFAPLISFMTACTVGKPENEKLSNWWIPAFSVAGILALGILTNDFHQLAFCFGNDFATSQSDYSYGLLFYAVTVWIYFFLLASIFMLWHKCRVASIKRSVWLPFIWLPIGTVFVILLAIEGVTGIESIFELPEIQCFILAAMWESCIQIGLIPCNTAYIEYFSNSGLSAQIADSENHVVYRAEKAVNITEEQMRKALKKPVLIFENTVLHSNAVCGGNIFWTEDITAVNEMNRELKEIGERLSEESDLLCAENEIKEQKARIAEQNRLYDSIAVLLKPQLDEIARLLESDGDFQHKMSLVCVLNCYVKRRANLALLADSCKYIDARELYLSIRESAEYVKLCSVTSFVHFSGDCAALSEHILLAFDIWQCCIEAGLTTLTAVMADIFAEEGSLLMKLTLDGEVKKPTEDQYKDRLDRFGGKMAITDEDGTVFVRLFIPRGGGGK